jgi:hypothetical protein
MLDPKISSAEDLLKDSVDDINRLRRLGISDFAVITYAMLLKWGATHEYALNDLLRGRSLTEEQIQFVGTVLRRISI